VKKPEILSPAGDIECIKAAFAAEADAVYFGLPFFNARQRAKNIEPKQLPLIVSEAKLRGIKLYLTLNTLITEKEIPSVLDAIDTAMISGITDFIIQDMGVLYILKKIYPMAKIHISTQTTTHTKGQTIFFSKCNITRVNLARELSLPEIKEITELAHKNNIETEVFIHGSYCLSYSGQCYLCSFLEGCSGNRGLCQQNCRRLYKKGNKKSYYLNLKDNSALEYSSELMDTKVDSLKIEGRIKSPAYVYSVVKGWKTILDCKENINIARSLLVGVFNRLFTSGYLLGNVNNNMFSETPLDRSLNKFAEVISYSADNFLLEISHQLKSDIPSEIIIKDDHGNFICTAIVDKIVNNNAKEKTNQQRLKKTSEINTTKGSYLYKIKITGKLEGKIKKGNEVFASMPALEAGEVKKATENVVFRKIPVFAEIYAASGEHFGLKLESLNKQGTYESDKPLSLSVKNPVQKEDITKQLSRFGNTPFELENIIFKKWENNVFIPSSLINSARRKCTAELLETIDSPGKDIFLQEYDKIKENKDHNKNKLSVFIDNIVTAEKLKSLYEDKIDIILEVNDPTNSTNIDKSFTLFFPGVIEYNAEEKYKQLIKSCDNKIILNNTSFIEAMDSGKEWIAGPFLNITNSLALKLFSETSDCRGAVVSLELSLEQIKLLAEKSELPLYCFIYSAVKLMTTRQCLLEYKCGKKISDSNCYYNCCGEDILDEINGRRIKIYKKEWNYTELYDSSFILIPEIVPAIHNKISNFIIDLRNFSFVGHKPDTIPAITELFISYLENPISANKNKITELFRTTSKGNFKKGI